MLEKSFSLLILEWRLRDQETGKEIYVNFFIYLLYDVIIEL